MDVLMRLYPVQRSILDMLSLHDCINLSEALGLSMVQQLDSLIEKKLFIRITDANEVTAADDQLQLLLQMERHTQDRRQLNEELLNITRSLANMLQSSNICSRFGSSHEYLQFVRESIRLTRSRDPDTGFPIFWLQSHDDASTAIRVHRRQPTCTTAIEKLYAKLAERYYGSTVNDEPMPCLLTNIVANNYLSLCSPHEQCPYTLRGNDGGNADRCLIVPRLLVKLFNWTTNAYVKALQHLCAEKRQLLYGCLVQTNEDLFEHEIGLEHRMCSLNAQQMAKTGGHIGRIVVFTRANVPRDMLVAVELLELMVQRALIKRLVKLARDPDDAERSLTVQLHHGMFYSCSLTIAWRGRQTLQQFLRVRYVHRNDQPRYRLPIYRNRKRLFLLADPHLALSSVTWRYHEFEDSTSYSQPWQRMAFVSRHLLLANNHKLLPALFRELKRRNHDQHFYTHYVLCDQLSVEQFAAAQDRYTYDQLFMPQMVYEKRNDNRDGAKQCVQILVYDGDRYLEVYRPLEEHGAWPHALAV